MQCKFAKNIALSILWPIAIAGHFVLVAPDQETDRIRVDAVREQVFAIYGAISQQDWKYVYSHSTEQYREHILASLIMAEELLGNTELSKLTQEMVDKSQLPKLLAGRSFGDLSVDDRTKCLSQLVSQKENYFERGLATLPVGSRDLAVRLPISTGNFIVLGNDAFVEIQHEFHSSSFHSSSNNVELQDGSKAWTSGFRIKLVQVKDKWVIDELLTEK